MLKMSNEMAVVLEACKELVTKDRSGEIEILLVDFMKKMQKVCINNSEFAMFNIFMHLHAEAVVSKMYRDVMAEDGGDI